MLVVWMVPNGVGSASPPANGSPLALVWQAAQLPNPASSLPCSTRSRSNADGSGRAIGASASWRVAQK
jgi:hypothetical protein